MMEDYPMSSNTPVVMRYSFDDADSAAEARKKLLLAGLSPEALSIHVLADEAGPAVGNFALDTKDSTADHDDSTLDSLFARSNPNEGLARRPVQWHGSTLLLVTVDQPDQKRQVASLLGAPVATP